MIRILTLAYIGSLLVSAAATPAIIRLSRSLRLLDLPGPRKIHDRPVPRTGGVAVILSMFAVLAALLLSDSATAAHFEAYRFQFGALFACSLVVGAVNLVDDLRTLRARTRFIIELLAAIGLCAAGVRIDSLAIPGWQPAPLGLFACPLTVLWIAGVTNAVNLTDGLDGLAGGIAATATGFLALFAFVNGQYAAALVLTALGGCLAGFLLFNFNPAKIFLGDCGSTFVGFFIASSGVFLAVQTGNSVALGIVALALGVPIFDTLFSMLRRFLERRSIFSPDRCHLHHRLLDLGIKHRNVVIAIYIVTFFTGALGALMITTTGMVTLAVFAGACVLLLVIFHAIGAIRFRESVQNFRRNCAIAREAKEQQKAFENAQLRFRDARNFNGWWQAACAAAEDMGFLSLRLDLTNNDGWRAFMFWTNSRNGNTHDVVRTIVPIRLFGQDRPSIRARVDVPVLTSLESAGLRVKLFSRLIDEHRINDTLWLEIPSDFLRTPNMQMQDTQAER